MTNSYSFFTLKTESVSKITIFGLKMMVKSGLEKIFFEIPPYANLFSDLLIRSDQNKSEDFVIRVISYFGGSVPSESLIPSSIS